MSEAMVVVCRDCGKAIILCASIRAYIDNQEDFDELVRDGHVLNEMPIEQARHLGACDCLFG